VNISSGGGFFSSTSISLSYTIAEMTMVQTFIQPSNMLTQGFQQPEQFTTDIEEVRTMNNDFMVYPNPSNGEFNVSLNSLFTGSFQVQIYDLTGQVIFNQNYSSSPGTNIIAIDLSRFDPGIYFLEFRSTNSDRKQERNIHKINLIY
jgi:hypothetical protein